MAKFAFKLQISTVSDADIFGDLSAGSSDCTTRVVKSRAARLEPDSIAAVQHRSRAAPYRVRSRSGAGRRKGVEEETRDRN